MTGFENDSGGFDESEFDSISHEPTYEQVQQLHESTNVLLGEQGAHLLGEHSFTDAAPVIIRVSVSDKASVKLVLGDMPELSPSPLYHAERKSKLVSAIFDLNTPFGVVTTDLRGDTKSWKWNPYSEQVILERLPILKAFHSRLAKLAIDSARHKESKKGIVTNPMLDNFIKIFRHIEQDPKSLAISEIAYEAVTSILTDEPEMADASLDEEMLRELGWSFDRLAPGYVTQRNSYKLSNGHTINISRSLGQTLGQANHASVSIDYSLTPDELTRSQNAQSTLYIGTDGTIYYGKHYSYFDSDGSLDQLETDALEGSEWAQGILERLNKFKTGMYRAQDRPGDTFVHAASFSPVHVAEYEDVAEALVVLELAESEVK